MPGNDSTIELRANKKAVPNIKGKVNFKKWEKFREDKILHCISFIPRTRMISSLLTDVESLMLTYRLRCSGCWLWPGQLVPPPAYSGLLISSPRVIIYI